MKIAVCGNYGVGNLGDEAILMGLEAFLKRVFSDVCIEVMGKGRLFPMGIRSFAKGLLFHRLWSLPKRIVRSADLIILGGGGLFSDEERHFVGAFWALQGIIVHIFGRPLFIMGVSIGRLNPLGRFLVKRVCRIAGFISVRDEKSFLILKKWGIKAEPGSDFAILSGPKMEARKNQEKKYILMSVRSFKNNDKETYTKIVQLCDSMIEKYGLDIKLIPLDDGGKKDTNILNKIFDLAQYRNKIEILPFYKNPHELLKIFHNAELVLAMRLHAGIFSLMTDTPFIALSYMNKVTDFWAEFRDIPVSTFLTASPPYKKLLEDISRLLGEREDHRKKLESILETLFARLSKLEKAFRERLLDLHIPFSS